jgi:hypothetical protein
MENEVVAGIIGGVIGGLAGTIGSWLTGYWGPRKLEKEKERREEERVWGPRKRLIKEMLDNPAPSRGRSLKTLKRVTGTPDDDLRRLLVELGARGFTRDDGEEAWDYEERSPLTRHALKDEKSQGVSKA